ncbi:unnamed protein product [Pieris brassicae]|uniref:Uncharacterized protein n=1 Tax=Pieris brassicae TaxID=7116 RepID=A0A9P0SVX8_PIEBR|nr:unnamed protein product [Pieris brassicae]
MTLFPITETEMEQLPNSELDIKMADSCMDSFEMWCWRFMLCIAWTAHGTNVSILKEQDVTKRLSSTFQPFFPDLVNT